MSPDSAGPVLALVDAHRPDGSADLPAVIALSEAGIPVAIVTAQAPSSVIRALISAGAVACIPKADLIDSLDPFLQSVLAGERYPTPELTASLLPSDAMDSLLPQQRQALHWHAAGIGIDALLQPCGIDREQFIAGIDALIAALPDHRTSANSSSDTAD
jgi:DNA-binding NarL/FixJ family response regulator